jgi:hypothetical protein
MTSGGGHFNLPVALFLSPIWFGILFWPLWGFLSVRFSNIHIKLLFIISMAVHFASLILYVRNPDNSDAYWFKIAMHDWTNIFSFAPPVVFYVVAQIFLWFRFVRDTRRSVFT